MGSIDFRQIQSFIYKIKFDEKAEVPRIGVAKFVRRMAGLDLYEYSVYCKKDVPFSTLLNLYAKEMYSAPLTRWCMGPYGCVIVRRIPAACAPPPPHPLTAPRTPPPAPQNNLSNFYVFYNDDEPVPLETILDARIGDICVGAGEAHKLEVRFHVCVACGLCCWPVACISKATCGYGDYRLSAPFFDTDPTKEWPLSAPARAPPQQVMRDAGMGLRAVPEEAAPKAEAAGASA